MKEEQPYIIYTDNPGVLVEFELGIKTLLEKITALENRVNAIEQKDWVTTDRIADNSVTGAKIAPFKDW